MIWFFLWKTLLWREMFSYTNTDTQYCELNKSDCTYSRGELFMVSTAE